MSRPLPAGRRGGGLPATHWGPVPFSRPPNTPVDRQHLAGDVAGVRRGKPSDGLRDLVRPPHPSKRDKALAFGAVGQPRSIRFFG